MKPKRKLKLERLKVNSFVTQLGDEAKQVKGGDVMSARSDCNFSCLYPCGDTHTCETCVDSCNGTCNTCVTCVSCNDSCNGTCDTCLNCGTMPCTLPGQNFCVI